MTSCDRVDPAAQIAFVDFDDAVAVVAEQVMMMGIGAEPVAMLVAVMGEDVDHAVVDEQGEGAVHGRDSEVVVARSETLPQLLCCCVVALARELGQHGETLRRPPHAFPLEELHELALRCAGHGL